MLDKTLFDGIPTTTAHVTEFSMVTANLARVLVSVTGNPSADALAESLSSMSRGAAPVRASFRWLDKPRHLIGFLSSCPDVRQMPSPERLRASFRVLAGNMYLDSSDQSLWEVKDGAGGKYLSRSSTDELGSLIEAARQSPVGSEPRMFQVQSSAARKGELVAFVHDFGSSTAEVDYGFCVESGTVAGRRAQRVISHTTKTVVTVDADRVVGSYSVDLPQGSAITASADSQTMIEYYKKLYSYSPEYLEKVITQIEEMAAA